MVKEFEYVPPEVVEKLKPDKGPTVTSVPSRLDPVSVYEFAGDVVLIQTFPKAVDELFEAKDGVTATEVVKLPCALYDIPPLFVA